MAGWPWPLDGVQDWFEGLWNWITEAPRLVFNWFWTNLISPAFQWIMNAINTVAMAVYNFVKPILDWLWGAISSTFTWIFEQLWQHITWLYNQVTGFFNWLNDSIVNFAIGIDRGIQDTGKWISDGMNDLGKSLTNLITDSFDGLSSFLHSTLDGIKEFIDTVLHGALEGMANLLMDGLKGLWDFIVGGFQLIAETVVGFVDWAISSLGGFFKGLITNLINQITPAFSSGSPPIEMSEAINNWASQYQLSVMEEIAKAQTASFDIKNVEGIAAGIGTLALGGAALGLGLGMAGDAAHPTKALGIRDLVKTMLAYMGTEKLIAPLVVVPYEEGVLTGLQQHFRSVYTLATPNPRDLAMMWIREEITDARFSDYMYRQGYPDFFQNAYKKIGYTIPDTQIIYELYWRGLIPDIDLERWLKIAGTHPELVGGLVKLAELIPPATDLITMVVREAFIEEMVTPAPEIFAEYMVKKGFSTEWADRYWTMHWIPMPLRDGREAVYRGIWDEEKYKALLKIADYHPNWRDDMTKVIYTMIGRIDLRRAWELGVIDDEELITRMSYLGYNKEDAELMASIHKAIAMGEEIGKIRDEGIADFKEGFIEESTLRDDLREIGMADEVAEYYVIKAVMRRERELAKQWKTVYVNAYRKGTIGDTELRGNLQDLGLIPDFVQVIVEGEKARKGYEIGG